MSTTAGTDDAEEAAMGTDAGTTTTIDLDWSKELAEQLDWHWSNQLRSRFEGLTDDEYRWEPVSDCWNIRPRAEATTPMVGGSGDWIVEFAYPAPDPEPVTTIAWRLVHVIVGVLGARNANHFGGPPIDYDTFVVPEHAADALAALDRAYEHWNRSVRALGPEELARPCGRAEGPYAALPMAALVLHINREVIHHGAEIALLRDLYVHRDAGGGSVGR